MDSKNPSKESTAIHIPPPSPYTPLLGGTARSSSPTSSTRRSAAVSVATMVAVAVLVVLPLVYNGRTDETVSLSSPPQRPNAVVENDRPAVARGYNEGVSNKSWVQFDHNKPFAWTDEMLSWQRTTFHFQPDKNWMNDPNGPLFYKGWYHLFYQYNPESAVWGNIVWGHAVSHDLIHWHHLPIAMVPDHWYDANGVWTGSATLLPDGNLVMLYTGSTTDKVQVQNLAYPEDISDPLLLKWVKYEGNPVLVPPPGINSKDFRDPTTAWLTPDGTWHIMIGSKINRTGITMVYDTKDFKNFKLVNGLAHGVAGTGMWECVDFYPVSTTEGLGLDTSYNSPHVKHVLKTSLDDDRNDYYALGTYDVAAEKWRPDDPSIDTGIGLRYDWGTFYASKTFYDQEKKRRVLWGWITEIDSEVADIQKGWASLQAIPRTVLYDNKTGTNLIQWPVEEVDMLRNQKSKKFDKVQVKPGSMVQLDVGKADELDIVAEFEVDNETMWKTKGSDVPYSCTAAGSGASRRDALGPFGLIVLADDELSEHTPIYFYIAKDTKGNFKTHFCADHLRSSQATDVRKLTYGSTVPVLKGETLSMRILVDHSIVESFAQGGRSCITSRVYPTKAIGSNAKVFLFNNATEATITASLNVWHMSPGNSSSAHKSIKLGPLSNIIIFLALIFLL